MGSSPNLPQVVAVFVEIIGLKTIGFWRYSIFGQIQIKVYGFSQQSDPLCPDFAKGHMFKLHTLGSWISMTFDVNLSVYTKCELHTCLPKHQKVDALQPMVLWPGSRGWETFGSRKSTGRFPGGSQSWLNLGLGSFYGFPIRESNMTSLDITPLNRGLHLGKSFLF